LLVDRLAEDEVATCVPIALEVLVGPPDASALDRDWDAVWRHLRWLPTTEAVTERSLELLRRLARTTAGAHRRRPIDYLVAACAEAADVVLWHWDRDLAAICEFAGIPHEAEHERARDAGIS
jgi:predicted nucleic acid-binding protein